MTEETRISRLRLERVARGLTMKEVANKLNKSIPTLHQWETGKAFPQIDDAYRLSKLYGITLEDLFVDLFHGIK